MSELTSEEKLDKEIATLKKEIAEGAREIALLEKELAKKTRACSSAVRAGHS